MNFSRLTCSETGKHPSVTDQIVASLNPNLDSLTHFLVGFSPSLQTAAPLVVQQMRKIHQGDGSIVPPPVTGQIPPTGLSPLGRRNFASPSELHDFVRPSQTRNHG